MKKALIILLAAVSIFALGPIPAFSEEDFTPSYAKATSGDIPTGEQVFADALLARPAGLIVSAMGLVGFVVALPFSLTSGTTSSTYNALIKEPVDFTFTRPMGDMGLQYNK